MTDENKLLDWYSIYAKFNDENSSTNTQEEISLFQAFDFEKFTISKISIVESTVVDFIRHTKPNMRPTNVIILSLGYLGKMTSEEFSS
jgi:hypothetical protein